MLDIIRADFSDPTLVEFLRAHHRDMEPTAPPESRHALDLDALRDPGVRTWQAIDGMITVGTVALAAIAAGHEELKSMRTAPERRGRGIASALLDRAVGDARARGVSRISLETGTHDFFATARTFYRRAGFREAAPFGRYEPDPHSVFLTLTLDPVPGHGPTPRAPRPQSSGFSCGGSAATSG